MAMNARPGRPADSTARWISVLGCTGSVGTQTIDLLLGAAREDGAGNPAHDDRSRDPAHGRFRVRALVAGRNAKLLAEQAIALNAERAVVADPAAFAALREALAGTGIGLWPEVGETDSGEGDIKTILTA